MIFASQCPKLCNLSHKNQNVCKSFTTVRKDPFYQFSCTATQLKCKRKIDHSAVSWHFQMIFSSQCDKSFILLGKNQSVFKSVTIIRKDSAYQFSPKVTHSKFSNIQENWQLHCLLTFSDDFCVTESPFTHTFRQKSKSVQKCPNSSDQISLPVCFLKSGRLGQIRYFIFVYPYKKVIDWAGYQGEMVLKPQKHLISWISHWISTISCEN